MRSFPLNLSLIPILSLCLFACNTAGESTTLSPANLERFYVTIPAGKDTIIRTPKGAAIKIRKGTFLTDQALEIREAYTMKDILLAGLLTESNGRPLRSGGMIYINTKSGESVALQKPITVLLPANGIEPGMLLFKGEEEDGIVNWVPTDSVQTPVSEDLLAAGKALYVAQCATCHGINRPLTGPALNGVQTRGPWQDLATLARWIRNPGAFIPTTAYTRNLTREYNGQIMPSYPQLSDYDIAAVMAFIQNESGKAVTDTFQLPLMPSFIPEAETISFQNNQPCNDTLYNSRPLPLALSDQQVTTGLSDTLPAINPAGMSPQSLQSLRNGFIDRISGGAYRFEIQTLGWYNVDAFVEGMPGTSLCELNVHVSGDVAGHWLNVYAFFPQQKNLSVGNRQQPGLFSFDKVGGKIPLYPGEKGIILVFGNKGEQFYYGTAHFNVKKAQTIAVTLRPATKEELLRAVKEEKIEGINLDVTRQEMKLVPCADSSANSAL